MAFGESDFPRAGQLRLEHSATCSTNMGHRSSRRLVRSTNTSFASLTPRPIGSALENESKARLVPAWRKTAAGLGFSQAEFPRTPSTTIASSHPLKWTPRVMVCARFGRIWPAVRTEMSDSAMRSRPARNSSRLGSGKGAVGSFVVRFASSDLARVGSPITRSSLLPNPVRPCRRMRGRSSWSFGKAPSFA